MLPARNELEEPETPVADEEVHETTSIDEIAVVDG
jgi:hypothetical protein